MADVAKKSVDVVSTLADYGVKGAVFVAGCGIGLVGAGMKEVTNLADEFSGYKGGHAVGDFMLEQSQKAAKAVVNKVGDIASSAINVAASQVKSRL